MEPSLLLDHSPSKPSRSRPFLAAVLVVLLSLLYAGLVIALRASPVVVAAAVIPFVGLFLLARPRTTLYIIIGLGLAIDVMLTPWMRMDRGVGDLSGHSLSWFIVSPLELLIMAAVIGTVAQSLKSRATPFAAGKFFWIMLPFIVFVFVGLAVGLARGGDSRIALWELRAILYVPAVYLVFYNVVRTRRQLHIVGWILLAAVAFDAVLGSWFYLAILHRNLGELVSITDHQEAVVFCALFILLMGHLIYRGYRRQLIACIAMFPVTLIAFVATNRRSAYIGLVVGIFMLLALSYRDNRKLVITISIVLLVFSGAYTAAFWNNHGFLGKPLVALRSLTAQPGDDKYTSNAYRVEEKWDIAITIHQSPVLGIGFGNKFVMAIPLAQWTGPFREYVTHNSILWVWMKTGAAGFFAFLFFIGLSLTRAARILNGMNDRKLKPLMATGLIFMVMYMFYSYVDQGWDYKGMIYMGAILGSFGVVERLRSDEEDTGDERQSAR